MALSIGVRSASISPVSIAAAMSSTEKRVPVQSFSALRLPAPIYCPIMMVAPEVMPKTMLVISIVTCPPMFTPDILTVPANCPTIIMSATLYSACTRLEIINGMANSKSCLPT